MDDTQGQPFITLLSLCLHVITAFIFASGFPRLGLPAYWLGESLWCFAFSALLATLSFFFRRKVSITAFLSARIFIFAILAMPLGSSLWLIFGLAFALVLDAGASLSLNAGTAIGAAVAAICLLRTALPLQAWNKDIPGRFSSENIFGIASLVLVFLLIRMVSALRVRALRDAELMRQLNDSILALTSANRGFLSYASEVERSAIAKERN
ncbi:MAG: hypothetical protein M0Z80_12910, partial [Treponema sp.]|nr:hypothetical protein [Treponema sp.]